MFKFYKFKKYFFKNKLFYKFIRRGNQSFNKVDVLNRSKICFYLYKFSELSFIKFKNFLNIFSLTVYNLFYYNLKSFFYCNSNFYSYFSCFNSVVFNFNNYFKKSIFYKSYIFKKKHIIFYFDDNLHNLNYYSLSESFVISTYNFQAPNLQPSIYLPYSKSNFLLIYGFMGLLWFFKSILFLNNFITYKNYIFFFRMFLVS